MKKNILIVADPETMDDNLVGWVGLTEEFEMRFADTDELAIELAQQQPFDMLLVDVNLQTADFGKLKAIVPILQPEALLVAYKGENSQDLDRKVHFAFDARKADRMKRLLILDSSNGGLNGLPPFSAN